MHLHNRHRAVQQRARALRKIRQYCLALDLLWDIFFAVFIYFFDNDRILCYCIVILFANIQQDLSAMHRWFPVA